MFKYEVGQDGKITKFSGTNFPMLGTKPEIWEIKDGEVLATKTPQELEAEGLDSQGNKLPTAAELEAEAESEKLEQERLAREAELAVAKAELGEGDWSEKRITQKAAEIKKREIEARIYRATDQKHRQVLVSVFGSELQLERDTNRYTRAKLGEFTDGENKTLIKSYEKKQKILSAAIDGIEEVRSYIAHIVDNDTKRAEEALESWENYPPEGDIGELLTSI